MFLFSRKYFNDIHIALAFTVLFTAYNSQTHIQKTLTISIKRDNPEYYADGYVSFGIIYTLFSLGEFIAPSIITFVGLKTSLVIGALCYLPFVTWDYFEIGWLSYVGASFCGFGAALLWTSQSVYTVLNSNIGSTHAGIGIFWILFQSSLFSGNSFVYYLFKDPDQPIDQLLRQKITIILGAFVVLSVLMLGSLSRPIRQPSERKSKTFLSGIKESFKVLQSKYMRRSIIIFIFCGLHLTFFSVFAASLGFTKYLSTNSKKYAPLSGVMQGVGEFLGSILAVIIKDRSFLKLRLIPLGCIVNLIAYIIPFLGLPDTSVFTYTDDKPFVELSINYFLLANVLCGLGDAFLFIETYNFIGTLYPDNSGPAFAMFKFCRGVSLAISFYCSNYVGFRTQTVILMASATLAFVSYYFSVGKFFSCKENASKQTSHSEITK